MFMSVFSIPLLANNILMQAVVSVNFGPTFVTKCDITGGVTPISDMMPMHADDRKVTMIFPSDYRITLYLQLSIVDCCFIWMLCSFHCLYILIFISGS